MDSVSCVVNSIWKQRLKIQLYMNVLKLFIIRNIIPFFALSGRNPRLRCSAVTAFSSQRDFKIDF